MTPRDEESSESRETLRQDLLSDEEFRYGYAESFLNSCVAAQIKTLREQRGMKQAELAERIGTKQAGISRLENVNYSAWKSETLRKLARALGVRLRISFETFGSLLDEVEVFNREALERTEPSKDPELLWPQRIAPKAMLGGTSGFYRPTHDARESLAQRIVATKEESAREAGILLDFQVPTSLHLGVYEEQHTEQAYG